MAQQPKTYGGSPFEVREWCQDHITEARFCPDCSKKKRAAAEARHKRKKGK